MKILHVLLTQLPIPPNDYGGTERVLWALYQGQKALGHDVKFLTKHNGNHPDGLLYDDAQPLETQIQGWADIIHFHFPYDGDIKTPYVCTEHSNSETPRQFNINTIYLSKKHADNNTATCYVHNGLFWPDYGEPNLTSPKHYMHFLAKASWRIKNLQGTVRIAKGAGMPLHVLGGHRFNIRRNPYLYLSNKLNFHGMVGGQQKNDLIANSKGLIFPVLWHEPFGLAVIESLYLGCPVFATPFGAMPDIVSQEVGVLSDSYVVLTEAVKDVARFDRRACHEHAKAHFSHIAMSKAYLDCYERVLAGESLNPSRPVSKPNIKARQKMSDE